VKHGLRARARGYWLLLHPLPVAMIMVAMLAFALVAAHGRPAPSALVWLLLSVFFSQAAIASLNDFCDRRLDAASKPWKPVPAGLVSPQAALTIAVVSTPLALLCVLPLGAAALLWAAVHTAGGLAYDLWLKGSAWSAAPFAAAFPALPIWAWSAVAPFEPRLLEAYLIGAPLVVGLHLADTWPDLEGDRAYGVRGLAHRLGREWTRRLLWAAFGAAALLTGGLAMLPGRAPLPLVTAAIVGSGLTAAAFGVSAGGARRWAVAFALLAGAAVVLAGGWLASLVG
jgi:4-hydroxybenzoate polyprenyltransferase